MVSDKNQKAVVKMVNQIREDMQVGHATAKSRGWYEVVVDFPHTLQSVRLCSGREITDEVQSLDYHIVVGVPVLQHLDRELFVKRYGHWLKTARVFIPAFLYWLEDIKDRTFQQIPMNQSMESHGAYVGYAIEDVMKVYDGEHQTYLREITLINDAEETWVEIAIMAKVLSNGKSVSRVVTMLGFSLSLLDEYVSQFGVDVVDTRHLSSLSKNEGMDKLLHWHDDVKWEGEVNNVQS
jgi:hypothetical protein